MYFFFYFFLKIYIYIHSDTSIAVAATHGNVCIVELLAFFGANINSQNRMGWMALHTENCAVLEVLCAFGADVNTAGGELDLTPIFPAVRRLKHDAVSLFLDMNCDLTLTDRRGRTASSQTQDEDMRRLFASYFNKTVCVCMKENCFFFSEIFCRLMKEKKFANRPCNELMLDWRLD